MQFVCDVCGWVYDEEAEGKTFKELPADWTCPACGAAKDEFSKIITE